MSAFIPAEWWQSWGIKPELARAQIWTKQLAVKEQMTLDDFDRIYCTHVQNNRLLGMVLRNDPDGEIVFPYVQGY